MVIWQGSAPQSGPDRQRSRSGQAAAALLAGPAGDDHHQRARGRATVAEAPPGAGEGGATIERGLADQLLVQAVFDEGLSGPRHRALESTLVRYAVPVLRQLLADGQIVSRAGRLGRPVGSPGSRA